MGQAAAKLIHEEFGANPRYSQSTTKSSSKSRRNSTRQSPPRRTQSHSSSRHNSKPRRQGGSKKSSLRKAARSTNQKEPKQDDRSEHAAKRHARSRPPLKRRDAEIPIPQKSHKSGDQKKKTSKKTKSQNSKSKLKTSKKPRSSEKRFHPAKVSNQKDTRDKNSTHEAGQHKDCISCTDTRPLHRFPDRSPTASCTHEPNICRRCLRGWIESEFNSKVWDQINCPECLSHMQYEDIKQFASSEIFRRYDKLSTKAALESIPGFRWCIAKNCKSGQVHDQDTATPKFVCVSCKHQHCIVHNIRWHRGETCAEYDYRTNGSLKKAEEAASKKWIKETAKRCPGCNWNIEKNYGCDHMTCLKCKYQFCWQCLAPYGPIRNQGNQMHRTNCSHYG